MLQRNELEEEQDTKLKTLSDDLKAWKTKVTQLENSLAKNAQVSQE